MPPLPLSASAPMCEGSCSRDADHRCRSSPRPERGVGDADRRWRGGVAKARSSPPVVARASGCNTPTSLCQYRPAPPQLRPWSLLAPRFVPRLPALNLHQPNLTITLRYPRATLQPYCPLRHHQSLPSTISSSGHCDCYQWRIACDETSLKVGKSFLFAPLNQNPLHVSERATLIARVGLRRVLRLAECLACESRVHMPGQDAQPAMSAHHLQLKREGIYDRPRPSHCQTIRLHRMPQPM